MGRLTNEELKSVADQVLRRMLEQPGVTMTSDVNDRGSARVIINIAGETRSGYTGIEALCFSVEDAKAKELTVEQFAALLVLAHSSMR